MDERPTAMGRFYLIVGTIGIYTGNFFRRLADKFRIPGDSQSGTDTAVAVSDNAIDGYISMFELKRRRNGIWPASTYALMPAVSTVMGILTICRLAEQVILYRGAFVAQFIVLSLLVGCPTLIFMVIIGQYVGTGMVDMWFVSPAFKGIGISLMFCYVVIAFLSTVPLSWIQLYLNDAAISNTEFYKFGNCSLMASQAECAHIENIPLMNKIALQLHNYFKHEILDNVEKANAVPISFGKSLCLVFVWISAFLVLSRGLKVFGKVVTFINCISCLFFCAITLTLMYYWGAGFVWLCNTSWKKDMLDPLRWALVGKEVFFTWNSFGGITMQMSSHIESRKKLGKFIVYLLLIVSAMLILVISFATCLGYALESKGAFLQPVVIGHENGSDVQSISLLYTPPPNSTKDHHLTNQSNEDGYVSSELRAHSYMMVRVATELIPGLAVAEGTAIFPPILVIGFYTTLSMFGFTQVLTVWMCLVETLYQINPQLLSKWFKTMCFLVTVCPLFLGLPTAMKMGEEVIHYFDFCISSMWWALHMITSWILMIMALSGKASAVDDFLVILSSNPKTRRCINIFLTVFWGAVLPVTNLAITITLIMDSTYGISVVWPSWSNNLMFMSYFLESFPFGLLGLVLAYQVIQYCRRDQPIQQSIKDLFYPALPMVPIYRRRQSCRNRRSFRRDYDLPPNYSPPPSYSAATGIDIATRLTRSRSLENVLEASLQGTGSSTIGSPTMNISLLSVSCESSDLSPQSGNNVCFGSFFRSPIATAQNQVNNVETEMTEIQENTCRIDSLESDVSGDPDTNTEGDHQPFNQGGEVECAPNPQGETSL